MKTATDRGFVLGVLWSVWWLHSAHGEDTYAQDLLIESVGCNGLVAMQRIAAREEYHFQRGWWADTKRRAAR